MKKNLSSMKENYAYFLCFTSLFSCIQLLLLGQKIWPAFSQGKLRYLNKLQEDPPAGVSGAPCDNNIMQWNAVIFGPADTPFEDGTFKLTISKLTISSSVLKQVLRLSFFAAFTEEYPNKPPSVRFVSKMFHPNVYADGGKCESNLCMIISLTLGQKTTFHPEIPLILIFQ